MGRSRKELDTSEYSGRVADRFRYLLDRKGMEVTELQQHLKTAGHDVPIPTLYKYLNGTRTLPMDLVPHIAKALRVTIRTFFPAE